MALADLTDWMDENTRLATVWYVKRLSGNDTLANGTNQAGPYIPKEFLFDVFPDLNKPEVKNPDFHFQLCIDSHADARVVRAVWYNNKLHGNPRRGRNEARVTGLGGGRSALLDPENTGALTIFAFHRSQGDTPASCRTWVCCDATEEDLVEDRIGPVEPGQSTIWSVDEPTALRSAAKPRLSCWLQPEEIPPLWLAKFPSGEEIVRKTIELRADANLPVDKRLMRRRDCEFEIFKSVEQAIELPWIKQGFHSVDEFIARAQTVLQRRKSRSGRSLELHTRALFIEEKLAEGTDFSHQPESEPGKRPDFLFPSVSAYRDRTYPAQKLRMLAVKTTCKDRWPQILTEADRVPLKHLLTLQEGISESQFRQMNSAGVRLVVPSPVVSAYSEGIQPHLQTLESFISDVRLLTV